MDGVFLHGAPGIVTDAAFSCKVYAKIDLFAIK